VIQYDSKKKKTERKGVYDSSKSQLNTRQRRERFSFLLFQSIGGGSKKERAIAFPRRGEGKKTEFREEKFSTSRGGKKGSRGYTTRGGGTGKRGEESPFGGRKRQFISKKELGKKKGGGNFPLSQRQKA